ncbi:DUF1285 domain-containing protein [Pelagibius sp. Alg239-R121]|uniref:DUF1285 domain-containing protein n=1 Tax=Pelagibius sp. Alg239-R121 TaxID=2993448 RepID=UPI0024A685DF|nr:DUF1285 domain-containing protein [Pelagibius sp. Alg239-R121]
MTSDTTRPTDDTQKIGVSDAPDQSSDAPNPSTMTPSLPFCGDFDIRIARDGTWFHQGSPIGRKPLVKLFSTVLRREDDGEYWLVTPVERGRVIVEDAPFTAVEFSVSGSGKDQALRFRTNVDTWVELDSEHPLRIAVDSETGEPRPYILVRDRLEALILRSVYYGLAELAIEETMEQGKRFGLWSSGSFFPLDDAA